MGGSVGSKFGHRPHILAVLMVCVLMPQVVWGQGAADFDNDVAPFIEEHCASCHQGTSAKGGLDLATLRSDVRDSRGLLAVLHLQQRLRAGDMPPPGRAQPDRKESLSVQEWADRTLRARVPAVSGNPGRVTVRRLSRFEYENTVREVFGVDVEASLLFPTDDLGYGFDNIGDALSVSVLRLEKYAAAAEEVAEKAIVVEDPAHPPARRLEAESMDCTMGDRGRAGEVYRLFTNGTLSGTVELPRAGLYRLRVHAYGQQAGRDLPKMGVALDGERIATFDVKARRANPGMFDVEKLVGKGRHRVEVSFLNDYYRPNHPDRTRRDRNLLVDWVEVVGPLDPPTFPSGHRWIFAKDRKRGKPDVRARPMLREILLRTWRRPPTRAEVQGLSLLVRRTVEEGRSFPEAIRLALVAALVSPNFIFRMEPQGRESAPTKIRDLDPWHLASRLSYFLWSAPPDERLRGLASKGELSDEGVLVGEALRMLHDPRSRALSAGFASQWLELRNLADIQPDPERFPLDPILRKDLRRETELFFDAVLKERLGIHALIDADFTFLNERLAAHYGIEGISGAEMRRVKLTGARRGGVLTHGSVHAVTSNPTRTSPVKRGKWILENLLDASPPPPPPGFDSFEGETTVTDVRSLRVAMEKHRAKRQCASCHARMDALGLTLENYDPIGRWRDGDGGVAIDSRGTLPDGREIRGPADLRKVIASDDALVRCLAKKLFVYAVGRPAEGTDELTIEELLFGLGPKAPTLEDLIIGIVRLDAFRKRGGPE